MGPSEAKATPSREANERATDEQSDTTENQGNRDTNIDQHAVAADRQREPSPAPYDVDDEDIEDEKQEFRGLEKEIAQLNEHTSNLETLCESVGTEYDNPALRAKIRKAKSDGEKVFKECFKRLKQASLESGDSTPADQRSRVMWFRSELDRFKKMSLRVPLDEEEEENTIQSSPSKTSPPISTIKDIEKIKDIEQLKKIMDEAAAERDYDKAARCQKRILALEEIEEARKKADAKLKALENIEIEDYDLERV